MIKTALRKLNERALNSDFRLKFFFIIGSLWAHQRAKQCDLKFQKVYWPGFFFQKAFGFFNILNSDEVTKVCDDISWFSNSGY